MIVVVSASDRKADDGEVDKAADTIEVVLALPLADASAAVKISQSC